jgi:iron(III) transport system substrate-binding protein
MLVDGARAATEELIAAAKREGALTWYTTLIVDQLARPTVDAFTKKYGIKVEFIRSGDREIALRLHNELRAGKVLGDIFDTASSGSSLKAENALLQWQPDALATWPKEIRDPEGYWIAMSPYIMQPGYNTDLIKKTDLPTNYQDLLDPKWKGKMAWNSDIGATGAAGFIGAALKAMGEEKGLAYLKQLSTQNITGVPGGARHVYDMVIAGEYPMALQMLNHHSYYSSQRGAPAGWTPINDGMAFFLVLNLMKNAPHPNAAKLLADFIVSPEGQAIFVEQGYIPVHPDMKPKDASLKPDGVKHRMNYFTPQEIDAGMQKWVEVFRATFR